MWTRGPTWRWRVPEKREFCAFFIVDDAQVSTKSATVSITV